MRLAGGAEPPGTWREGDDQVRRGNSGAKEKAMNEDVFNTSIRRFLKTLGVTAQREIEKAVRQAVADGRLKGNETLSAQATVTIGAISLTHEVGGDIALE
jgi:hypothetical protein